MMDLFQQIMAPLDQDEGLNDELDRIIMMLQQQQDEEQQLQEEENDSRHVPIWAK